MNCCLSFLFFCCISGIVVFIILAIFTYTNNSFLIMENMRKKYNEDVLFDKESKEKAYLQYFIAALFDCIFALLIYILSIFCENRKTRQKPAQDIQNIKNENIKNEIAVINSVGTHDNIIEKSNKEENINNLDNEINTNKGMTEKEY